MKLGVKARPLPLVLAILDGWGHRPDRSGNAILNSEPRNLLSLQETYPSTLLRAAGEAVGLPDGFIGNSEVGHTCLGAGRTVLQDLTRIHKSLADGSFARNPVLVAAMEPARRPGSSLHLMGLLSDGGVHSHIEHLLALVKMAGDAGVRRVVVHAFLDGRDTPPRSGLDLTLRLSDFLEHQNLGIIGSVCGRYFAMDRDRRWDRTERAYRALVHGEGERHDTATGAVQSAYDRDVSDEFVPPTLLMRAGETPATVADGDSVIFFNFRADRARQLTRAFTEENFTGFVAGQRPRLARYTCMTVYHEKWNLPSAFEPVPPHHVFGELIASARLKALPSAKHCIQCAEAES